MSGFRIAALDMDTWPDFALLVERHNGVWGGCWCMGFHPESTQKGVDHRTQKEARVRDGRAHAALVYDADRCVGWCQFGSPDELTRIKFGKVYRAGADAPPDWRITCFFVDKEYRHRGVAEAALGGALREIARLGGGVVESSPEDVAGRKVSNAFLYNATAAMFERHGFVRTRQLGKNNWLVTTTVRPARPRGPQISMSS